MKKMVKSKEGISPILATLLLIVIAVAAVIVTYAWVMTFTTSTTSKAGAVLSVENTRFYNSSGLKVDITIRNSGTADAKIVGVYNGTSSTNLAKTTATVSYNPTTQMAVAGGSLTITLSSFTWTTGTTYYFKVVTDAGQSLPFNEKP
jgi:flagellin-like protein